MFKLILRNNALKNTILACQLNRIIFKSHRYLCNTPSLSIAVEKSRLFEGILDRFNGVTVNLSQETFEIEEFNSKLEESMKKWIELKRRAVWFKIDIDKSDCIPVLAERGFKFHHTKNNVLAMYKWLSETEPDGIPSYSHTLIGVGGLVVNDNSQILVVSEKHYSFPHWKLPGGSVDPDEDLEDAVVREVKEETGIKTKLDSLITIRHAHNRMFDCSDLYFVFALKPLSTEIFKCPREIMHCEWMNIDEYLNHPHVHEFNRTIVHKYFEYKKKNIRIDFSRSVHEILKVPYKSYFVVQGD